MQGSQEKIPSKVPKRFPGTGSQAKAPSKRFPSKVPRNRFPSKVPKQGSQEEVPSKVPKQNSQAFPSKGSQQEVPKQEEVTKRKVFRKRFSGKVPKWFQARFPGTSSQAGKGSPPRGSQARVPRKRFPSKGSQEEVSRNRFPSKVPKDRFASKQASQEQVPKQGFE